jgi:hypothetical protein
MQQIRSAAPLFSVLLCLWPVVDASAQQSATEGWVFGFDLGGAVVAVGNAPSDRAGLVGARVGYGLNRILTLYVSAYESDIDIREVAAFDTATFGHSDVGARLHLANGRRRWVPYGDFALTFWAATDVLKNGQRTTTDFQGRAGSFSAGGGVAFYMSETLALDVNIKRGKGGFRDVEIGNLIVGTSEQHVHTFVDIAATSTRLTFGVSWWP